MLDSAVDLKAVFVANGMGIVLMLLMLWTNFWRLKHKNLENRMLVGLIILVLISCISDSFAFFADGKSGFVSYFLVYFCNLVLYIANLFVGPLWLTLVSKHIDGNVPKIQIFFISFISLFGVIILIINFFQPIVFNVNAENFYERRFFYFVFLAIAAFFIFDSIIIYIIAKIKGGSLKFFPILEFILPAIVGIVIQSIMYGVSTIWPFFAISITGILSNVQNEFAYCDRLTGLYNRAYIIDRISQDFEKAKTKGYTLVMIDINEFKKINDTFGHSVGDEALIKTSKILSKVVSDLGLVIRYGGDEFIIIMNTQVTNIVLDKIAKIKMAFQNFNETSSSQYNLSVSLGYSKLTKDVKSYAMFLNDIDNKMYIDKTHYHSVG